ncbi:putative glycoside hydrolase [Gilvimarinus sp. SDUM040013]|uniref:Glycoside hydrolase n=1 Tax=Gilvimarinus gilvus TaxID=3058038 RepID=A0ABU4RZA3_9GAMM|nr:putative glycoside hydrolase [Gilvimarinus sp. SDUM040013]MDO3387254.1 putative glycoside hydrolase [Gilvimarinus sp. SDUM040013]MDX6848943.1 putative glycoside hydrolase [Gilvimarinus sp. SDUM040013]
MNVKVFLLSLCLVSGAAFAANEPNPNFVYFTGGQTPGNWEWVLQDPDNWWKPIPDSGGESGSGKLVVVEAGDTTFPGALRFSWTKSEHGVNATISGTTLDLSALADKAELMLALKVNSSVPKTVNLKIACGENCEAQVNIADNLKQAEPNTWFALPLALDCFTANGLDAGKINWPVSIGTSGALDLDIAEISLSAMAEGDEGCVPNP